MPGQKLGKKGERPGLQSLGKEGMISIGQGFPGDFPGLVPGEVMVVHQKAHQLRYGNGGMGVVEMDRKALVEAV